MVRIFQFTDKFSQFDCMSYGKTFKLVWKTNLSLHRKWVLFIKTTDTICNEKIKYPKIRRSHACKNICQNPDRYLSRQIESNAVQAFVGIEE